MVGMIGRIAARHISRWLIVTRHFAWHFIVIRHVTRRFVVIPHFARHCRPAMNCRAIGGHLYEI